VNKDEYNTPDFTPDNVPDLSPVHYSTWTVFVCPMLIMDYVDLPVRVCVCLSLCVRHTFHQLAYRSDRLTYLLTY